MPQAFPRAFFFGSPKPFLFGPFQKEMGSGSSRPGTGFPADHFFFAKKKRSAPQRKKLSGVWQSTPISGAEKYCDHWDVLLPGVMPCRRAAFGADTHPPGAPAFCTLGRRPEGVLMRPESTTQYRRRRTVERATFSHRSPAPGAEKLRPRLYEGPFSLAARNHFFLDISKKWILEVLYMFQIPCRKNSAGKEVPHALPPY